MQNPTPKQIKALWGLTRRWKHNEGPIVAIDWISLANRDIVTRDKASEILSHFFEALKHPKGTPEAQVHLDTAQFVINQINDEYCRKYRVLNGPDPSNKEKKEEKEEEEKEEGRQPEPKSPTFPNLKIKSPDYIKHKDFDEIAHYIKHGIQTFLFGPTGSGKSRMLKEIALCLDLEFCEISMAGGMRYSQILGGKDLDNGRTQWTPAYLLQKACVEPIPGKYKGRMIFTDELLSVDPDCNQGLNAILEPACRHIETPGGDFKVLQNVVFVAAANTQGRQASNQYTAAQRQDDSLLGRFLQFHLDYDAAAEKRILKEMKLSSNDIAYLTTTLEAVRKKIKEHNKPFDPCTRRLIRAAELIKLNGSAARSFELAFINSMSKAERALMAEVL